MTRRALFAALTLLLTTFAAAQERFANGNPVRDGRGNVYYATGEPARMPDGTFLYRNAGFGGVAFRSGAASYPNGQPLRSSNGTLFYSNGQVARQNGTLYHRDGSLALDAGGARYSNGAATGGGITLREPFPGGCAVFKAAQGGVVGWLLVDLGDGWSLVVNVDSGAWEVTQ